MLGSKCMAVHREEFLKNDFIGSVWQEPGYTGWMFNSRLSLWHGGSFSCGKLRPGCLCPQCGNRGRVTVVGWVTGEIHGMRFKK